MKRLSKRLSRRQGRKHTPEDSVQYMHAFQDNEDAWVSTKEGDFVECTVLTQSGVVLTIRTKGKRHPEQVDLRNRSVYPRNRAGEAAPDMTALHHINDACILYNLEQRAYKDEPYSFMGNVLVSINPLREIQEPKGLLGKREAALTPHPWAIAEYSFQQMSFAADNRKKRDDDLIVNQSIVASGESGAGKTEASKRVLHHLVQRCANDNNSKRLSRIDNRLLQSNEITESFGNAKTLRNDNSSRFGKFMKLHFSQVETKRGTPTAFLISAASVQTYLLERSRVSLHDAGERNYHVFYQLLAGADKAHRTLLGLDHLKQTGFRYLAPLKSATQIDVKASDTKAEMLKDDAKHFKTLQAAMQEMGFSSEEMDDIFNVVAGILHLGNVGFADEETLEGDLARPVETESGYDALGQAGKLLGVPATQLEELLVVRSIQTREGVLAVHRNSNAASFTRDAVAKGLYSRLFDFVVGRVNQSLDESATGQDVNDLPFIGVLDIFGFESFARNGFEQLLINFTNESLQSTFNRKVFEAELNLYQQEGLVVDQSQLRVPPGNEAAMTLLAGALKYPGSLNQTREDKDAVLVDLDTQCRELQPSDKKMLRAFHQKFNKHPNFPRPHPKNMHDTFIIKHYAGVVVYTVGNFIEKNNDALPAEINTLFGQSASTVLGPTFAALAKAQAGRRGGKSFSQSIVKQFRGQILELLETLETTACSFIRCVKPNATMQRGRTNDWFSRPYVAHQLRHLSIPQTAMVLKSGLPTRIRYETLVASYMNILPPKAVKRFKSGKATNSKLFVSALFWAFEIKNGTYKMGHTKVFFKAGEIAALDKVLQRAAMWTSSSDPKVKKEQKRIGERFSKYYARLQWRRAFAKVYAQVVFVRMIETRRAAAIKLQSVVRRFVAIRKVSSQLKSHRSRLQAAAREAELRQKRALERQKTLELKTDEVFEELTHVVSENRKSIRFSKQPEEFLSEDEETLAGADADSQDGESETDSQRQQRYLEEIQEQTEEATEKEIRRIEREGGEVDEDRRDRIRLQFEEQFTRETARFEAMRRQNKAIQNEIATSLKKVGDSIQFGWDFVRTKWMEATKFVVGEFLSKQEDWLMTHAPALYDQLSYFQENLDENLEEMYQNPVLRRDVTKLSRKVEARSEGGQSNVLTRTATLNGRNAVRVNAAEVSNPVNSVSEHLERLQALAKQGKISPEDLGRLVNSLSHALDRRASRTHSLQSNDEVPGIPVICDECGENNNTSDGLACKNCKAELPVEQNDIAQAFTRPSREDGWAGEASLHVKGGEFFIRMMDGVRSRHDPVLMTESKVLLFECAWETKSAGTKKTVHTRWMTELSVPELITLDDMMHKNKKYSRLSPPAFPQVDGGPARYSKSGGRMTSIKRTVLKGSGRRQSTARASKRNAAGKMSLEELISGISTWLDKSVEVASQSKSTDKAGNNLIFQAGFDEYFEVSERIDQYLEYEFEAA